MAVAPSKPKTISLEHGSIRSSRETGLSASTGVFRFSCLTVEMRNGGRVESVSAKSTAGGEGYRTKDSD